MTITHTPTADPVHTAERAIIGHCPNPTCGPAGGAVLVVLNAHEAWPLVSCHCGWEGATDELVNYHRLDRGWLVSDGHVQRELRP